MVRLVKSAPENEPDKPVQPAATAAGPAVAQKGAAPRRRWWRLPLMALFTAFFLGSGWFTYKVASATDKIFTENTTGGSPVLQGKKTESQERINILLIGVGGEGHDGANLADTIQVASIDPKTKQIAMLSIPRDLYVQVPHSYQKVKINEVHSIGEDNGTKGGGPALLKEQIAEILDVPVHYFVRVDFDGFKQIIDSIGGIDVTVSQRLYDPYYPRGESRGYEIVDIRPGPQHLDGAIALKYARSRETTNDFDRSRRQQEVLVAVREKALNLAYLTNPSKITQLLEILGDHVKTDLSLAEVQRLAQIVRDIPPTSVNSKVLDNTGLLYDSIGPGGAYILLPRSGDYTGIREFANQLFEGAGIQQEQAKIELQNASGRGGIAKLESDALIGYGYQITGVTNAAQIAQTTVIYDYTNGAKSSTVNYLAKRYKAQVIKEAPQAPGVDIRVVIGTDYAPQQTSSNTYNGYSQSRY